MSHGGYAAPVSSWNGTRSQLDKEISNEKREQRKRAYVDPADQGRVKHLKMNGNTSVGCNSGYNPIQVCYFFLQVQVFEAAEIIKNCQSCNNTTVVYH